MTSESTGKNLKSTLMTDIQVIEHMINTYSRMDAERVPELEVRLKCLEWKLLDIMVNENDDWLEMFKEQNCI